jgi:hypothetical protein
MCEDGLVSVPAIRRSEFVWLEPYCLRAREREVADVIYQLPAASSFNNDPDNRK